MLGLICSMKNPPFTKPAARSNSKKIGSKRLSPDELIKDALERTRACIEAAQSAVNHINALVLAHRVKLVPEATIVRESATLLQHVEQNFRHLALDHLNKDPRK